MAAVFFPFAAANMRRFTGRTTFNTRLIITRETSSDGMLADYEPFLMKRRAQNKSFSIKLFFAVAKLDVHLDIIREKSKQVFMETQMEKIREMLLFRFFLFVFH